MARLFHHEEFSGLLDVQHTLVISGMQPQRRAQKSVSLLSGREKGSRHEHTHHITQQLGRSRQDIILLVCILPIPIHKGISKRCVIAKSNKH